MSLNPTLTQPLTFEREVAAAQVGLTEEGVQRVADCLAKEIDPRQAGGQLVVLRRGRVVLDRAFGLADVPAGRMVDEETPFLVFSIAKPLTALAVHHLVEQGRLELDAPVADYWPAFARNGKAGITLRQVLLHQAGLPRRGMRRQLLLSSNWPLAATALAWTTPEFAPGTQTAYHFLSYGLILGEVVRRVSGQPIERYLAETFCQPLGLSRTYLGLPTEASQPPARLYASHPDQARTAFIFNLPRLRRAVLPAAGLHSTARDLAVLWQMLLNGGLYAGRRLLQAKTIAAALALGYEGYDATVETKLRWAYGFHLGGPDLPYGRNMGLGSTPRTFGHFGQRSSMVWADPEAELAVAFTTNQLLSSPASRSRLQALSDSIWQAIQE